MSDQTMLYAEETKWIGRGHELGPPHVWSFGGLLAALEERLDAARPDHERHDGRVQQQLVERPELGHE